MYYHIDGIKNELANIREDLDLILKAVKASAQYHDEDETDHARELVVTWCRDLMGDCCNLYAEIEKRFGIDVYND